MLPSPSVQSLRASLVLTFHAFFLPTPKVLPAVADVGNELSRQTGPAETGSVATSAPTAAPSLSAMIVATLTNRAVTAIFVVRASQNTSSGDIARNSARSNQEITSREMGSRAISRSSNSAIACLLWVKTRILRFRAYVSFRQLRTYSPGPCRRGTFTLPPRAAPRPVGRSTGDCGRRRHCRRG
jgi:hypothetical protein